MWEKKHEFDKAIADYTESIADYDAVIGLQPQEPGAYNAKAWLLAACPDENIRNGKDAVVLATKACEIHDWVDADSLDTLAAAFAERGDFGLAIAMQAKANALYAEEQDRLEGGRRISLYRRLKPFRFEP